ncbi:magnesium transporter CorA family protein [Actinokineospora sp.]|uniref:magnesium transporter CorA family protein n=1 Tax=Actinokineospora sp. TaxID=1872133 RepID=UPI0040377B81
MTRTRLYRDGELSEKDFPIGELADRLTDPAALAWVDLRGPGDDDLTLVGDQLGLHRLAMEDARQRRQRPKLDHYREHLFLTAYAVRVDPGSGALHTTELGVFVTERALVTVHDGFDMDPVLTRWDTGDLRCDRVGVLLHGLLDDVVDGHLDAVETLDELLEDLEDRVFDEHPDDEGLQRHTVRVRRTLGGLRRVVLPMREVLTALRRDHHVVDHELEPYFADIGDHVAHASESTESLRELVTTIRETQLNIQGNRLNLIMKKVTGWAAIIAIPTAVTGFYGQNVPYPGSEQPWGVWASTVAIVVLSGGLYAMFRRKDWL